MAGGHVPAADSGGLTFRSRSAARCERQLEHFLFPEIQWLAGVSPMVQVPRKIGSVGSL
jgi:hypothetical protein